MNSLPVCSLLVALSLGTATLRAEPLLLPLWPEPATPPPAEQVRVTERGEHVVSSVHRPGLTVYLPDASLATGTAIVICPGGGHRELWVDHEGYAVAQWLATHGIAGIVLKYRLARETGSKYRVEVESLADAQQAIRLVRSHAAEWKIDPARVGIMGFSAGGELAALASQQPDAPPADAATALSARPSFQVLVYPGNSKSITPAKGAPPAFLVCGADDRPDISEGLADVYLRFKRAGVPVELHVYAATGHGFGLRPTTAPVGTWTDRCREWLAGSGLLAAHP